MNLVIEDKRELLGDDFSSWLIDKMKIHFYSILDKNKLIRWDKYLNETETIKKIYDITLSSEKILKDGIESLVCDRFPQCLVIHIDRTQLVFGLYYTKLESLCKLINYGNSQISGYPILSEVFQEFVDNIDTYIDRYVYVGF